MAVLTDVNNDAYCSACAYWYNNVYYTNLHWSMSNLEDGSKNSPEPVHRHPKWQAFEIGIVPRIVKIVGHLHSENPQLAINPRSVEVVKEALFNSPEVGEDKNPANVTDDAIRDGFKKYMVPKGSIDVFNS